MLHNIHVVMCSGVILKSFITGSSVQYDAPLHTYSNVCIQMSQECMHNLHSWLSMLHNAHVYIICSGVILKSMPK